MAEYSLTTPLKDVDIKKLKAGYGLTLRARKYGILIAVGGKIMKRISMAYLNGQE